MAGVFPIVGNLARVAIAHHVDALFRARRNGAGQATRFAELAALRFLNLVYESIHFTARDVTGRVFR